MSRRSINLLRKVHGDFNVQNASFIAQQRKITAVSTAKTLTAADSGATLYWTHSSSNHDITLPAATIGLHFKFVIAVGYAALHNISCVGSDEVFGSVKVLSTTDDKTAVQHVAKGQGDTDVRLHTGTSQAALAGNAGDVIDMVCVEEGHWLVTAVLTSVHAAPSGIAVLV